jgi:hypothetical protein
MAKHTKETLGFNSFSGYYASVPQGYGGLQYGDVDYLNASYWQNEKTNWCDTGYQNAISGAGEALTWNTNGATSYGLFESTNLKESFTLASMVVASAWETDQAFNFRSYTYKSGHGFILKASDTLYLSQTAQKINFAKIGKPGDFKNIVAVEIVSGSGKYGNTCTYGRYGYTTGNEMAFDNLKLIWNGKIPTDKNGRLVTKGLATHDHGHAAHAVAAHLAFGDGQHCPSAAHLEGGGHSGMQTGFHTELLSLGDSQPGDLTAQFRLPAVEHFGT